MAPSFRCTLLDNQKRYIIEEQTDTDSTGGKKNYSVWSGARTYWKPVPVIEAGLQENDEMLLLYTGRTNFHPGIAFWVSRSPHPTINGEIIPIAMMAEWVSIEEASTIRTQMMSSRALNLKKTHQFDALPVTIHHPSYMPGVRHAEIIQLESDGKSFV